MRRMPAILLALFSLVTSGGPSAVHAQPQPQPPGRIPPATFADSGRRAKLEQAFPEIDRLFGAFALKSRVPGIAYGVLIDGQLAHIGTVGVTDVVAKTPVTTDTVFRIASMTKSFTALAIMKLRDEGKLNLEDPAERYIPELAGLAYPTADAPKITIRHLLSHAEGFPEDNPWGDRQLAATDDEMARMMRRGIPFSTAPGTAYEYSNFGFAILGRIVARVSGMPYKDYVATRLLDPLGMTSTTLQAASVPPGRLTKGYRLEDGQWVEEPPLPDGAFGAMGGMLTSTRDLAKYVAVFMSAWPPRDAPDAGPVRRSSVREMQQVWRPAPATVMRDSADATLRLNTGGYGFGLRVWQTCAVSHVVAHSGGLPGFGSQMRWLPEHGVAVVAMGNLTYTSWGRVIDEAIEALAKTGALQPRVAQPSAALLAAQAEISSLVGQWDDGRADRVAADNLYLDAPKTRRRAELDRIRAEVGECRGPASPIEAENALRGLWTIGCARGWVRVGITLAPTVPPLVQQWTVVPVQAADGPPKPASRPTCADR
jgi:CubicO group peptidase (beta-lactamase class C family)